MQSHYNMWINGKWKASKGKDSLFIKNPATNTLFAEVPDGIEEDFVEAIDAAKEAYYHGYWGTSTPADRSLILSRLADLVERNKEELARLESTNTGKPYESVALNTDMSGSIDNLRYYAALARDTHGMAAGQYVAHATHIFRHEPVGVVGHITPWNYPFQMAIWKIGPALAAGCTIVLKPASNTPLTTLYLGEMAKEAGLPDGVLNIVTGRGQKAEILATHRDVRMISLTGSSATGSRLMALASSTLKRLHFELGGKAPVIVLPDADIEKAAATAVMAGTFNSGQDCTAATRIYVDKSIYRHMTEAVVEEAKKIRVGDPFDSETLMGPLISRKQLETVSGYVHRARRNGATILLGGDTLSSGCEGFYFPPTIITDVEQSSEIVQEEVFGPVLTIQPFEKEDEAVELGNDVIYGLAASVWTRNIERALDISHRLEFGTVWINDHLSVASEAPHGGFKQSGFGKELSHESVKEYQVTKNIMIS